MRKLFNKNFRRILSMFDNTNIIQMNQGKNLSDDEILQLMANNPILIERPIIIKDEKAVIARPLEKLKDFMK